MVVSHRQIGFKVSTSVRGRVPRASMSDLAGEQQPGLASVVGEPVREPQQPTLPEVDLGSFLLPNFP